MSDNEEETILSEDDYISIKNEFYEFRKKLSFNYLKKFYLNVHS